MHTRSTLEVQGHRGALGLLPENTLPGFEIALDVGVTSIETDVLLTRDDVAVLFHDVRISERVCSVLPDRQAAPVMAKPLVRSLTLEELRGYRVHGRMDSAALPLAQRFAAQRGIDPYGIPTLVEFLEFVLAYAGSLGEQAGKTSVQRENARRVIFDIELKRIPFCPYTVGDGFSGAGPAMLEQRVVEGIRSACVLERTRVRSFDHRSALAVKTLEPKLEAGLLIDHTTPAQIAPLLAAAQAELYCPDYHFVDAEVVRQVHAAGKRIMPYTVNEPDEWEQLCAWGVDGITTDFPDRLLRWRAAAKRA